MASPVAVGGLSSRVRTVRQYVRGEVLPLTHPHQSLNGEPFVLRLYGHAVAHGFEAQGCALEAVAEAQGGPRGPQYEQ